WSGVSGGFNGNWEVFPYTASGNLYLSDRASGLYIVRPEPLGRVFGTIRDATSGAPLPSATITLAGAGGGTSYADETGAYRLLAPDTRSVTTEKFGYVADITDVAFSPGVAAGRDVALARSPGAIVEVVLTDGTGSAPIASAHVSVDGTPLAGD